MNAILFLFKRKIVNWFKQLRYNKSKLVMVIVWSAFILFTIVSSFIPRPTLDETMPPDDGAVFAIDVTGTIMIVTWTILVIFMIVQALYQGTKRGSSVFTSPDIQFIFTGPLRGQTVLTYGMLNSLTSVFISTFFLIYQIPNMRSMGLGTGDFVAFLFAWFFIVLVSQLATMAIYLMLFDHQQLAGVVRIVVLLMPMLLLAIYAYMLLNGGAEFEGKPQAALYGLLDSWYLLLMPFLGWSLSLMAGVLTGMTTVHLIAGALLVASLVGLFVYIQHSDADFYEDAMGLTYEREDQLNKQKSGQIKRVKKIRKTGLNKGWGVNAIFYRQLREYRRSSPLFFTPAMIFYLMGGAMIAIFLRAMAADNEFDPAMFSSMGLTIILSAMLVVMFWHGMFSSMIAELESTYFYTAPASPMQKLIQASRLGLIKILVDIAPSLIIVVIVLNLNPLLMIPFVMAALSAHLLISGVQLLTYRLVGQLKGSFETMVLIFLQTVALGPTIGLIVVTFVVNVFDVVTVAWPFYLLITIINLGIYCATLPAGVNALEKGLDR